MIRIDGVTKRYRKTVVLHDVQLTIPVGSSVALWGPNGAGKTTLLLTLMGFLTHHGTVTVFGSDARRTDARASIGFVPQHPGFPPDLTVADTLTLSATLRGLAGTRIGEVVDRVGIALLMGRRTGTLSGGERQRLSLALALLPDPPVLLLDEPTANLDAAAREGALEVLEAFRAPDRILVVASHHLEEVSMLAERVIVMANGRVVDDVPAAALSSRLGLRSRLHLRLDPEAVPGAVAALGDLAIGIRSNGSGLIADLAPAAKAEVVATLVRAGITVHDIEVWR